MLTAKQFNAPRPQRRPADTNSATGEIEDVTLADGKNAAAVTLGRLGGKAGLRVCPRASARKLPQKQQRRRWKKRR